MNYGLIYSKGTLVLCPRCQDEIAELRDNIFKGMRFDASIFIWKNQQFAPKERFKCKKCSAELISNNRFILTKNRSVIHEYSRAWKNHPKY